MQTGRGDDRSPAVVALEHEKRPVSAVADAHEFRNMVRVEIEQARTIDLFMMFDPGHNLDERILAYDKKITALAKQSEPAQRLMAIEGIGPITATALVASVGNAQAFKSGRQFAAWLGLTPRQHSSGGKSRLGAISKRGDVVLRTLLIHGTRSTLRLTANKDDSKSRWAEALKARSCNNVAAVALAAKNARIIWAMLARGTEYRVAA